MSTNDHKWTRGDSDTVIEQAQVLLTLMFAVIEQAQVLLTLMLTLMLGEPELLR